MKGVPVLAPGLARWMRRGCWLALVAGVLAVPLGLGVAEVRERARHKALLLEVQRALQAYHVDQEMYVPREEMAGAELIGVLNDFGFLEPLPMNPWSGAVWALDGEEPDGLRYGTDTNFATYILWTLEDSEEGARVVLELDSLEHTSL